MMVEKDVIGDAGMNEGIAVKNEPVRGHCGGENTMPVLPSGYRGPAVGIRIPENQQASQTVLDRYAPLMSRPLFFVRLQH